MPIWLPPPKSEDGWIGRTSELFGDYEQSCKLSDKVMDKINKLLEEKK